MKRNTGIRFNEPTTIFAILHTMTNSSSKQQQQQLLATASAHVATHRAAAAAAAALGMHIIYIPGTTI